MTNQATSYTPKDEVVNVQVVNGHVYIVEKYLDKWTVVPLAYPDDRQPCAKTQAAVLGAIEAIENEPSISLAEIAAEYNKRKDAQREADSKPAPAASKPTKRVGEYYDCSRGEAERRFEEKYGVKANEARVAKFNPSLLWLGYNPFEAK